MCLNDTCSKIHLGANVCCISYSECSETRRWFIAIAFELLLKNISSGRTGLNERHQLHVFVDDVNIFDENVNCVRETQKLCQRLVGTLV
jgi:hypothetical protein